MPKKKITRSRDVHKEKVKASRSHVLDVKTMKHMFSKQDIHQIAVATGFMQRERKLNAHNFFSLVLGPLKECPLTLTALAENFSMVMSRAGISKRFTQKTCVFLQAVYVRMFSLIKAQTRSVCLSESIFGKFSDIKIIDSSSWKIPAALKAFFAGYNQAGCKIQFLISYTTGHIEHQDILPEASSDQEYAKRMANWLKKNELILFDLGYAIPQALCAIAALGAYFLCRFNDAAMNIYKDSACSDSIDILRLISTLPSNQTVYEIPCFVGNRTQRTSARLIAVRAPEEVANRRRQKLCAQSRKKGWTPKERSLKFCDWTFLLTNIPPEKNLTFQELFALYAIRWTIELFFKQLKSVLNIHKTHVKSNPERLKAEILARHIAALLIAYCYSLARSSLWQWAHCEISFEKTVKYFKRHAAVLLDKFLRSVHNAVLYLQQMIAEITLTCEKYRQPNRRNSLDKLLERTLYREFKYVKIDQGMLARRANGLS